MVQAFLLLTNNLLSFPFFTVCIPFFFVLYAYLKNNRNLFYICYLFTTFSPNFSVPEREGCRDQEKKKSHQAGEVTPNVLFM